MKGNTEILQVSHTVDASEILLTKPVEGQVGFYLIIYRVWDTPQVVN